ncbi:ABC transporter permease [Diplocloster hominis]|uniref:ABC transporter permease n=1 Tax=Diplocloster hominis TaxID=3079010 RepID=UPI0031BB7AE1
MAKHTSMKLTVAQEFELEQERVRRRVFLFKFVPLAILALLVISFGILTPQFLQFENIYTNILDIAAVSIILGVGITPVVLTGAIDLSLEGFLGFGACFFAVFIQNSRTGYDWGIGAVLLTLIVVTVIGGISGAIHVYLKLPSFMVTFAIGYILKGVGLLTYMGVPGTITDEGFRNLYFHTFLKLPITTWIAFGIFLIGLFLEKRTAFGRYVYAIGDNEQIPLMSGIHTSRVKILVFMWSGFCCGAAGLVAAAKLGYCIMSMGSGTLFPTLTAVVVGGTLLTGGVGGVVQTIIGVFIVTVINNGMVMLGVDSTLQSAVQGIILLLAVVIASMNSRDKVVK